MRRTIHARSAQRIAHKGFDTLPPGDPKQPRPINLPRALADLPVAPGRRRPAAAGGSEAEFGAELAHRQLLS
jgi:hypothetical protein